MTRTGRHSTRFAPHLESLEAREVPAVLIFVTDHTLDVIGDGHANIIKIQDNGQGTITVDAGNEQFTASGIHNVNIATGGGGDRVSYQLTGTLETTENITASLGTGSDKGNFDFSDGIAGDGHLSLVVYDGAGADHDTVTIGKIAAGGSAFVNIHGGSGNNTVKINTPDKIAGTLVVDIHNG
jgi:hypothetical protein